MLRHEFPSLRRGLVGAWCPSLGDGGPLLREHSRANRPATLNSGCSIRGLPGGVAVTLNGTSGIVTLGSASFAGLSAVSVAYWACVTSSGVGVSVQQGASETSRVFFAVTAGDGNYYLGGRYPSGDFYTYGTTAIAVNRWTHFVGIIRTGTSTAADSRQAFTNGVANASVTHVGGASPAFPSSATAADIGERFTGSSSSFVAGSLDDIRIYNRVLTLAEIRLLATRRGIGLVPAPTRRVPLPRPTSVNVGGSWKESDAYVNVGGEWRLALPTVNVGGTWK